MMRAFETMRVLIALSLCLMTLISPAASGFQTEVSKSFHSERTSCGIVKIYDNESEYENGSEYGIKTPILVVDNQDTSQNPAYRSENGSAPPDENKNSSNNQTNTIQQSVGFFQSIIDSIFGAFAKLIQIIFGTAEHSNSGTAVTEINVPFAVVVAVSSSSAILALFATIYAILPKIIVAPFFTRISQGKALENENRKKLYDLIKSKPGLSVRDISRESGMDWRTVLYHISVLKRHHFISVCYSRNRHNIFENGGRYKQDEREIASAASNENAARLIEFLRKNPGATQKQICETLGYSAPLASWHTKYLEKMGLLEKRKEGKSVMHYIIAAHSS